MQLLTHWVTQIIVFLLIAIIVDLLIPASSMKRYINLVVGLILILIFLQPLFKILHIDIQQALKTTYHEMSEASTTNDDMESSIKMQKKDIQASQDAYIVEQLTNELTDLAEEDLENKYDAQIRDMQFDFASESDYTYEDLEEVVVTLEDSEREEGVVKNVEDIHINTEESKDNHQASDDQTEEIQQFFKHKWEIDDKKVTVLWEGKKP